MPVMGCLISWAMAAESSLAVAIRFIAVSSEKVSRAVLSARRRYWRSWINQAMSTACVKIAAVIALLVWLARTNDRLSAASLGLIIGGAIGNAIDRFAYGWVFDFVFFHIHTATWEFNWYVFNLADAAIVVGVIGLLYESLRGPAPQKRPDRP